MGCKKPLVRACGFVRKDCTVTGPYSSECKGEFEAQKKGDSENISPGFKEGRAAEVTDAAGERSRVEAEEGHCEPVCCRVLRLTLCDREPYLKLRHRAKDGYSLMEGIMVSLVGMVENEMHTLIIGGLCSLIRRV